MGLARGRARFACAAALVLAAGLSGCGSHPAGHAAQPVSTVSPTATTATATPTRTVIQPVGPPSGSKAEAANFVLHLLSTINLPTGAKRLPQRPVPAAFGRRPVDGWGEISAGGPSVSASSYRLWRLPESMPAAYSLLRANLPADEVGDGYGSAGLNGVVTSEIISAHARKAPSGLSTSELAYTIVPSQTGGSLLLVAVQVYWYPPRPAAEDFVASSFRAVTVSDSTNASGSTFRGPTLTARRIVAEVVHRLDEVHVGLPATFCGIYFLGIVLHPVSPRQPTVYLSGVGCGVFFVQVGSTKEPPLSASTGLVNLVRSLLG
jgi:hypothetical protein